MGWVVLRKKLSGLPQFRPNIPIKGEESLMKCGNVAQPPPAVPRSMQSHVPSARQRRVLRGAARRGDGKEPAKTVWNAELHLPSSEVPSASKCPTPHDCIGRLLM